jgi:glycosyl transferase-like sugar-binding protein
VTHRSDFIRAYLLRHYGGLYLDADCAVLRNLEPIMELAERFGFAGYRDLNGQMCAAFMAPEPGAEVIEAHYRLVRDEIRGGGPRAWTGVGAIPLTAAVAERPYHAHLLIRELAGGIDWSESAHLAKRGSDDEQAQRFNPRAYYYMLSNDALHHRDATRFLGRQLSARCLGQSLHFDQACPGGAGTGRATGIETDGSRMSDTYDQYSYRATRDGAQRLGGGHRSSVDPAARPTIRCGRGLRNGYLVKRVLATRCRGGARAGR